MIIDYLPLIALEVRNEDVPALVDGQFVDSYEHEFNFEWRNEEVIACFDGADRFVDAYEHEINLEWRNEDVLAVVDGVQEIASTDTAAPEPGSDPYVVEDELNPAPGSTDISAVSAAYIPCGDRISTTETDTIYIPTQIPATDLPDSIGIDPLATVIRVQYGIEPPVVVFQNGSPLPGWAVSVSLNDHAGPNRSIDGVGRNYLVSSTSGWRQGSLVTIYVDLVDLSNNDHSYSYSFLTSSISSVRVDEILLISREVVRIAFSGSLAVTSDMLNTASYTITPLNGDGVVVEDVAVPGGADAVETRYVFLIVRGLVSGCSYHLSIDEGIFSDTYGRRLPEIIIRWTQHYTKMDKVVIGLSHRFVVGGYTILKGELDSRSIVRGILEAITISDEIIGGDF